MEGKKKWNWTLLLCVMLLLLNLWQGKRISDLEQDIWNAQNSVMDSVSRLDSRVGSLRSDLEKADNLVQDWSYASAVNAEKRGLDIRVSLVLKEWQADTAVELLWSDLNAPGGETAVPLSGDGTGAFAGTVPLMPYELSGEYALDAVITNGDGQRRESLGYLGDAASLLPVQCYGWGAGGPDYTRDADKSGTLTVTSCEAELIEHDKTLPELSGQVFRLRRNGEIASEKAAAAGYRMGQYTCGELSSDALPGDQIILTFFCRDENGLSYEFCLNGWSIDEGGIRNMPAPTTDWPKLTWN